MDLCRGREMKRRCELYDACELRTKDVCYDAPYSCHHYNLELFQLNLRQLRNLRLEKLVDDSRVAYTEE